MPEIITGYITEQKVVIVANDETSINDEITAQAVDMWIVGNLILLDDTNMVILFTRTIAIVAP